MKASEVDPRFRYQGGHASNERKVASEFVAMRSIGPPRDAGGELRHDACRRYSMQGVDLGANYNPVTTGVLGLIQSGIRILN